MALKTKKSSKSSVKKVQPKKLIFAFFAVVIAAVIISAISISKNNSNVQQEYNFGKKVAQGIDVSEHNGDVNWEKVKEDFDFAFIRVGYRGYAKGNIVLDETAKYNMKMAKKADIPFGVYFYTQAITEDEAREEAKFLLKEIKHYTVSLPIIFDFEYASDSDGNTAGRLKEAELSPEEKTKIINAFFDEIKDSGYSFGLYASSSMLKNEIDTDNLDEKAIIWVADYNNSVTYNVDYTIWQYSKTGKSDAVSSNYVDLNYWYSN